MVDGRRDLRPALPVGGDPGRRELPDRDQHRPRASRRARLVFAAIDHGEASSRRTKTLPNNTYYWRVRGVDPQGQAGPWNNGPAFTKTYDETAVPGPPNLHIYNTKLQLGGARRQRQRARLIQWSTVPGARTYEVRDQLRRHVEDVLHGQHGMDAVSSTTAALPRPRSSGAGGLQTGSPPPTCGTLHRRSCAPTRTTRSTARLIAGLLRIRSTSRTAARRSAIRPPTCTAAQPGCAGRSNTSDVITPSERHRSSGKSPAPLLEAGRHGRARL